MRTGKTVGMAWALALAAAIPAVTGRGDDVPAPEGWKLKWHDEFDGSRLDAGKWSRIPDPHGGKCSDWNRYTSERDDLVEIRDGALALVGVVNADTNADPRPYLQGQVWTRGKFSFLHGRIEIRAKFEAQKGAWPAFWMLPDKGKWPDGGEIDIIERLNDDPFVYQTCHSAWTFTKKQGSNPPHGGKGAIVQGDWNVYGFEWDDAALVWSVNGKETFRYPRTDSDPTQWPYSASPFYILLDQQLEGSWVGKADPGTLPVRTWIDWVRVYERVEKPVVHRYPNRWLAPDRTWDQRKALVKQLWRHDAAAETKLWPAGKIPLKKDDRPLKFVENELWQKNLVVTDVNDPFFTFFPAPGGATNAPAAVVLPGGGYSVLGWNKEGTEVADWLNANGFAAAVLLYRAPDQREAALCDVQRAIRLLRANAAKYGVDPKAVGVIGFSAGANLAAAAATRWRRSAYERVDAVDDLSCRPDFQIPIYLWDVLPEDFRARQSLKLAAAYPVDAETPPAFLSQAQDDFCQIETSVGYFLALRNAGVPCELHVFPSGGHGYGARALGRATDDWPALAAKWLRRTTGRDHAAARTMKGTWCSLGTSITWYNDNVARGRFTRGYQDRVRDVLFFDGFVNRGVNGGVVASQLGQVSKADYYTIEHGVNDWGHSTPVGTLEDYAQGATNRTFCANYRRLIDEVRKLNPAAKIILCTPRKSYGFGSYLPPHSFDAKNGIRLEDYAKAVRAIAAHEGFPVADFFANCGEEEELASLSIDKALHPNDAGYQRMADELLRAFLEIGAE